MLCWPPRASKRYSFQKPLLVTASISIHVSASQFKLIIHLIFSAIMFKLAFFVILCIDLIPMKMYVSCSYNWYYTVHTLVFILVTGSCIMVFWYGGFVLVLDFLVTQIHNWFKFRFVLLVSSVHSQSQNFSLSLDTRILYTYIHNWILLRRDIYYLEWPQKKIWPMVLTISLSNHKNYPHYPSQHFLGWLNRYFF